MHSTWFLIDNQSCKDSSGENCVDNFFIIHLRALVTCITTHSHLPSGIAFYLVTCTNFACIIIIKLNGDNFLRDMCRRASDSRNPCNVMHSTCFFTIKIVKIQGKIVVLNFLRCSSALVHTHRSSLSSTLGNICHRASQSLNGHTMMHSACFFKTKPVK